ncbi:MAG: hypothetical protein JRE82_18375 [Deltaproteobacteria bacterium]|nr:hypothetical protein [Deltaproteobacteria bacterium]
MSRSVAVLVTLLIGGCSWLNAPERNLVPPDGGIGDGIELFCDDGLDDDGDMAFDCDDSDCSEEPACCERRTHSNAERGLDRSGPTCRVDVRADGRRGLGASPTFTRWNDFPRWLSSG